MNVSDEISVVNRLAPSTNIFVEIVPDDELGAQADPTDPPILIDIAYSSTRRLPDSPTWLTATWQANTDAVPAKYYAKGTIAAGDLVEGLWWPFVRVHNAPEEEIVAGKPFRVE